jgi:CheY-like chemotaxis protein
MGGSTFIELSLQPGLWLTLVDPTQIELVILNLAINARDAMEVGGTVAVETANVSLGPPQRPEEPAAGEYVAIVVTDTGTGMTDEVFAKCVEPFFTTKEVGKGSGLGLSQVLGFVKQSGGGLSIQTTVGKGTTVRVYLPRAGGVPPQHVVVHPQPRGAQPPEKAFVLLVDDDASVREITASMLQELGYAVQEAGSGGAALEMINHLGKVDVMLIDFAMPGMNGAELARNVRARRPGLPILFVTGYADTSALADIDEDHIIRKPFLGNELETKLHASLNGGLQTAAETVVSLLLQQGQ